MTHTVETVPDVLAPSSASVSPCGGSLWCSEDGDALSRWKTRLTTADRTAAMTVMQENMRHRLTLPWRRRRHLVVIMLHRSNEDHRHQA